MHGCILIVDGTATNRIVLKVKISDSFYRPILAADGESALRLARSEAPDLILLSLSLPDRTGPEMLAALRGDRLTRGIPVIALADHCDRTGRLVALTAGADDVMTRPLDDTRLMARIRNLLRMGDDGGLAASAWGQSGDSVMGLAEPQIGFDHAGEIALVATRPEEALSWKRQLQARMRDRLSVMGRDQAMALPASNAPDVFVIDANLDGPQGGLRLMSQLVSHAGTRHSVFCLVAPAGDQGTAAMAFDLGAHDVISPAEVEGELHLRLRGLLRRKQRSDRMRAALETGLRLAVIDPLTGIYNRRYAMPRLAGIAAQAGQEGSDFAVMVVDLDRFKDVNDRYGHAAGDAVLVEVARRLAENLRMNDLIARIGGEEFLVALPQTSLAEARLVAERLRRVVGEQPVRLASGDQLPVTVSIGVSVGEARRTGGQDAAEMVERADRALLNSKTAGRNVVTFSRNAA